MNIGSSDERAGVHEVRFGSDTFECQIRFSSRKRFRISIHPDLRIVVDAPTGAEIEEVLANVSKHGRWIVRQRLFFEQ